MDINNILSMLFFFFGVVIIVGLAALFYIHQWTIKHEYKLLKKSHYLFKQGNFLQPYIPIRIVKQHIRTQIAHQKEAKRIRRFKVQLIITLVIVFILNSIVVFYQNHVSSTKKTDLIFTPKDKNSVVPMDFDWKIRSPK